MTLMCASPRVFSLGFDVCKKHEFGEIAQEVVTQLDVADLVVTHNASFDLRVQHSLLEHFQIPAPPFQHQCTLSLARQTWPVLPPINSALSLPTLVSS